MIFKSDFVESLNPAQKGKKILEQNTIVLSIK